MPINKQGGKTQRKYGRNKRKLAAKGKPLSLYVRDKISFEQYQRLAGNSR